MKVHRTHYSLATYVYLPLTFGYLFLYFFLTAALPAIRTVHWVFLALTLFILISPQRNERYGSRENRMPWPKWLLCVTGFVALLNSYFYFIRVFIDQVLSINKPATLALTTPLSTLQEGGLFPWALVALFTITIQRVYTEKRGSFFFSRCIQPIFNVKDHSNIGQYCNQHIRSNIFVALCSALTFIGLASLALLMHEFKITLSTGINLVTMVATTVLFCVLFYTRWMSFFNLLIQYRCPALLALLIMLFSALGIMAFALIGLTSLPNLRHIQYELFNPASWTVFYQISTLFLVLCWLPLASATLALLSRGYCFWQIIAAIFLVPVFTSGLNYCKPSLFSSLRLTDPVVVSIGLILCSLALLWLYLRPTVLLAVWRGIFPLNVKLREGKPVMYIRTLVTTAIGMTALYWGTGVYLGTLALSGLTIGPLLLIMLAVCYWIGAPDPIEDETR